jgi:hypothetical protein
MVVVIGVPLAAVVTSWSWPRGVEQATRAATNETSPIVIMEPAADAVSPGSAKPRGFFPPEARAKAARLLSIAAKPDGAREQSSAARFARAKGATRIPVANAKLGLPLPVGFLADLPRNSVPDWLRGDLRKLTEATLDTVPELTFHEELANYELFRERHPDASSFVDALVKERPDLDGLPFFRGPACRLGDDFAKRLGAYALGVREALGNRGGSRERMDIRSDKIRGVDQSWLWSMAASGAYAGAVDPEIRIDMLPAMMQILAVAPPVYRAGIAEQLKAPRSPDLRAAHTLVRLALFDPHPEVRAAAVESLRDQPLDSYAGPLVDGFRYPWAPVPFRAADAVIQLKATSLLPHIVDLLDEPDPTAPRKVGGKTAVREMVRINHHRNCLLCHAKADNSDARNLQGLVAPVPSPDRELPPLFTVVYYDGARSADVLVRANETYLRQDFSTLLDVKDPGKWSKQQRFDFFVRTRVLTAAEAKTLDKSANDVAHHRRAALYALHTLTDAYLGPNAADWRPELRRRFGETAYAGDRPGYFELRDSR